MEFTIIDYGVGNLFSIAKALERAGAKVRVIADPESLLDAGCIVFPGVGAFGAAMNALRPVLPDLKRCILKGTPALGICLGMQIMFERSEESSGEGLALFDGDVKKLKTGRIPEMGWNDVMHQGDALFDGIPETAQFYFANSYVCHPEEKVSVAMTEYGERFPSAIRKGNLCGVQFHPEKSGPAGLRLLRNFVKIAEGTA
jgi:glutamine amidotransferase